MKTTPLLLVIAVIGIAGCQKTRWETYDSAAGGFSVLLPASPEETTEFLPSPAGDIVFQKVNVDQPTALYEVSYADYPDTLFAIQSPGEILEGLLYTYTVNGQVKPLSYTAITLGEHQGNEVEIFSPDGQLYIKARAYFVGRRLYELTVITRKEHSRSVDIDEFLDSFRLIESAETIDISASDSSGLQ
jgi:hypothetical protein